MKHERVYLAGPLSGDYDANAARMKRAAEFLRDEGLVVFCPPEYEEESADERAALPWTWEEALARDLHHLVEADTVYVLSGWERSRGCVLELMVARTLRKPVWHMDLDETGWSVRPWAQEDDWALDAAFREHHMRKHDEWEVVAPTGGRKNQKLARTDLLPVDALIEASKIYGYGAAKYGDRNWERGYNWSLSYAALLRHLWAFWGGEDLDSESHLPHLASVVFHALALLHFWLNKRGTDDRPGR